MKISETVLIILFITIIYSCTNGNKPNPSLKQESSEENTSQQKSNQIDSGNKAIESSTEVKNYTVEVIRTFKHDPKAYTQGLVYYKGCLYESTGLRGSSSLRKIDPETGKIIQYQGVSPQNFCEGIAIFNNKIYQLTWENQICFVYDLSTFNMETSFDYYGEGWGLTNNNEQLIMSNGSNIIKFIDPDNFQIIKSINVYDKQEPIYYLNELEIINGEIYANVFETNKIVRIDPETGRVTGWIDLSKLRKYLKPNDEVEILNGIAYDKEKNRIFVTGKNWPLIFEVRFVEEK